MTQFDLRSINYSMKSNKTVKIFSNVKRCFIKVEELVLVYEMLLKSKDYGTYNMASPLVSYYERIVQICKKNNIKYEKLLIPTTGNIIPLEQNIDGSNTLILERWKQNNFK